MKKSLVSIVLLVSLLFALSSVSLGAIYSSTDDLWNFHNRIKTVSDSWYSVEPDNDPGFVELGYTDFVNGITALRANYILESGLFAGFDYYNADGDDSLLISPGYRFKIKDQGYASISVNYLYEDENTKDITGYNLDLKLYGDGAKFVAQYYIPDNDIDDDSYVVAAAFKADDQTVIGFSYYDIKSIDSFDIGLTWKPEFMTVDIQYANINDFDQYRISGMYNLADNLALGAEYIDYEVGDSDIWAKIKFTVDDATKLFFGYNLENDTHDDIIIVNCLYNIK